MPALEEDEGEEAAGEEGAGGAAGHSTATAIDVEELQVLADANDSDVEMLTALQTPEFVDSKYFQDEADPMYQ
eukprot:4742621-Prymnesium_polylepis.1